MNWTHSLNKRNKEDTQNFGAEILRWRKPEISEENRR